eukprot:7962596-Pyramimonas_sp.AAC.1
MHSLLGNLEPSLSPSAWQSLEGIVPPRSGGQSSLSEATWSTAGLVMLRRSTRASCPASWPLRRILNSWWG